MKQLEIELFTNYQLELIDYVMSWSYKTKKQAIEYLDNNTRWR